MPETLSLQEFDAIADGAANPDQGATGAGTPRRVSASDQAGLDRHSLDELKSERGREKDPTNQASLDREIARRKQTAAPKTMSLGDFENMAEKAQKVPAEVQAPKATANKPEPTPSYWQQVFAGMKRDAKSAATLADMTVNTFGGLAGSVVSLGAEAQYAADGATHKEAGKKALAMGNEVAGKLSDDNYFAKKVAGMLGEGEQLTPSKLQGVMEKLNNEIDSKGGMIEDKTHGIITKEDVQIWSGAVMNFFGAKGLIRAAAGGLKMVKPTVEKVEAPTPEGTPPKPPGSPDAEPKPKIDFKTFQDFLKEKREADGTAPGTPAKPKVDFQEYQKHLRETADAKVEEAAQAQEAAASNDPINRGHPANAGKIDPKLAAGLAVGATGIALMQAYPEKRDELALAGIMGAGMIGPHAPKEGMALGSLLSRGENTLTTLGRLNQNHTEFPVKRIEEELRRPEVPKAEKDLFQAALVDVPKDGKVSAADLTKRLQEASGNFELKRRTTDEYADYGLTTIGRGGIDPYEEHPQGLIDRAQNVLNDTTYHERADMAQPPGHTYDDFPFTREQAQSTLELARAELEQGTEGLEQLKKAKEAYPETTIYQTSHETNVENHFNDPKYFAHARSFTEDGVKHVVEIQSDLVQKNPKPTPPKDLQTAEAAQQAAYAKYSNALENDRNAAHDEWLAASMEVRRARQGRDLAPLAPMWRDWYKRIAREELADSARKGQVATRFATADTVAKVEGWPENDPLEHTTNLRHVKLQIKLGEEDVARWEEAARHSDGAAEHLAEAKEYLAANKAKLAELEKGAPRFPPKYQGIYDRYKKEMEPFLRKLGGNEVTDELGHTWIEVPTRSRMGGRQAQMFGGTTPEQLWNIAALSLGAAAGAYLDPENPIVGMFKGALVAGAATVPGAKLAKEAMKGAAAAANRRFGNGAPVQYGDVRATPLIRARDGAIALGALNAYRAQVDIVKHVPEAKAREKLTAAVEGGGMASLTGDELKAGQAIQRLRADADRKVTQAKLMPRVVKDFIRKVVVPGDVNKAQALFDPALMAAGGTPVKTVPTIAQLKAAGVNVLTEDAARVLAHHLNAAETALANKGFADQLQMTKIPSSKGLMAYPANKAPKDYVDAGLPGGAKVHPDLEGSVRYMFEAKGLNSIASAGVAFNSAIKRMEVINPLFHTRSLLEARLGSTWNILKPFGEAAKFIAPRVFGKHAVLEQLEKGGPGNAAERGAKAGLMHSFEGEESIDADIRGGFFKAMDTLQRAADKHLGPTAGMPLRAINKLNHGVENMMWGRVHTGYKLITLLEESEKLSINAGKRGMFLSSDAADIIAAKMANMRFGGLNWHMMAEEINNRYLRNTALHLFSNNGRAAMGVIAFAPDWTISTLGAFMATLQKGSGVRGLWQPVTLADLARQQLIRSGLYYLTVANAVNWMYSGHYIWDNGKDGKSVDWTYIDRGDGTKMQIAKHFAEPFHAMAHPGQFALNKLGVIPSEALDQATGHDFNYLRDNKRTGTTELAGPPMKNRLDHALGRLKPIGAPDFSQGAGPAALGLAGMQVYGKTKEQARQEAADRRNKRFQDQLKNYRKLHGLDQ